MNLKKFGIGFILSIVSTAPDIARFLRPSPWRVLRICASERGGCVMKHTQHLNDWKQSPSGLRWNWFIHRLREEKRELDEIPFPEATKIEYIVNPYCLIEGQHPSPNVNYEWDDQQKEFVRSRR